MKKGRPAVVKKEDDIIRKELAKVRATRMEGSFGTQKEHYGLKRIKARTKLTSDSYCILTELNDSPYYKFYILI